MKINRKKVIMISKYRFYLMWVIAIIILTVTGTCEVSKAGNITSHRCGCDIIRIGDPKHKVLSSCGLPTKVEIIGYTGKNCCGRKIEEVIYGPKGGYFYYLEFVGNRLSKIESIRQ